MFKRMLKNEKGFTLIELLAVIVILGIIAAIAIPAIGNVIDNSRRDSHIANARMMVDATRMYLVNNPNASSPVTLETLVDEGYINNPSAPGFDDGYDPENTKVFFEQDTPTGNVKEYQIVLIGKTGSGSSATSIEVIGKATDPQPIDTVTREDVKLPGDK
ncbi:prepilin-type N-terminal cleavage/methylation domain-containing protein [Brevibacillus sp. GCM10020057]|uniref:prepilin-type N-terminal cleavage/methylation domain-containing protein n=1 Tax=Brevibacillus sp. GCM10020057 TaxID=3317327 RepID=UPI00363B755B